jgi:hypothetical protein
MLTWVFLPLLWHSSYGLWLSVGLFRDRPSAARQVADVRRRRRALQSITGCLVLAFLFWHLSGLSFPGGLLAGAATDSYDRLILDLSSTGALGVPVAACLYTLGSSVTLLHAAHGLLTSLHAARLVQRFPRAAPRVIWGLLGLTLVPLWLGVLHFATGWP